MYQLRSIAWLLSIASSVVADLVDNGQTVTLNGISYYVGGVAVSTLSRTFPGGDLFPLTVLETSSDTVTAQELNSTISNYLSSDDVFQEAFLGSIYLSTNKTSASVDMASCAPTLSAMGSTLLMTSPSFNTGKIAGTSNLSTPLPKGPYFVSSSGHVFKAHRLYDDDYLSFIQGIVSDEAGGYFSLPSVTENVMAKSIAVPSRLYYTATPDQPLAGLRFGVKDIYHVKGIRTSGGSRTYYYTYGPQNVTAPSVQRLIDRGAVLVGKMGTVQFANGDNPTADWVDLHCPFNARADGYQSPSGSSAGPGSGMGAYSWLDLAVGSDTGGSMRGPAGAQGIYGNRPSTGAVPMDHVIPLNDLLDTAGVYARSASLWATAAKAWYSDFRSDFTSYPSKLYYGYSGGAISYGVAAGDEITPEAAAAMETFMTALESFLNVNRTIANYTQLWLDTHSPDAPADVNEMLNTTYAILTSVYQYENLGVPLFADYAAKHGGRRAFINPGPLARWQWGQANNDYSTAEQNMTLFREWFETEGYGRNSTDSCSEGLYVYPWSTGAVSYRNRYFNLTTHPPLGMDQWAIAGYGGAPDLVVPIGEAPYNSTITLQQEWLPVSMSLVAARGCDLMLANLVDDLEKAGILKPVITGTRMYEVDSTGAYV